MIVKNKQIDKYLRRRDVEGWRKSAEESDRLKEDLEYATAVCNAVHRLYEHRKTGCPRSIEGSKEWRAKESELSGIAVSALESWWKRFPQAEEIEEYVELI